MEQKDALEKVYSHMERLSDVSKDVHSEKKEFGIDNNTKFYELLYFEELAKKDYNENGFYSLCSNPDFKYGNCITNCIYFYKKLGKHEPKFFVGYFIKKMTIQSFTFSWHFKLNVGITFMTHQENLIYFFLKMYQFLLTTIHFYFRRMPFLSQQVRVMEHIFLFQKKTQKLFSFKNFWKFGEKIQIHGNFH